MNRIENIHMPENQHIKTLSFLKGPDWQQSLQAKSNPDLGLKFASLQVKAEPGLSWCIDDRPTVDPNKKDLQSKMAGGAAGWTVKFVMMGQTLEQAVASTELLYKYMGWGQMRAHIDDDHGAIQTGEELANRNFGCGFEGKAAQIADTTYEVLKDEMKLHPAPKDTGHGSIISMLRSAGAEIVPLTGSHKKGAAVVVNSNPDITTDRKALFDTSPAFVWDAGATTNNDVLANFNTVAKTSLNQEQFFKLQTTLHLATGLVLGVLNLDASNSNLAII